MGASKKAGGFTLVELLVAVAVIGIIAAVAFPSYQSSVKQTWRSDAMSELTKLMQQQERFFINNSTYTSDFTDLGYGATSVESENAMYTIVAAACGAGGLERCVVLTATPKGAQAGDGQISLSSRGEKGATGEALAADVWG